MMMATVNGDSDDGDDNILQNLIMDTPSDYFITVDVNKKKYPSRNPNQTIQSNEGFIFHFFWIRFFFIVCFSSNTDFRN